MRSHFLDRPFFYQFVFFLARTTPLRVCYFIGKTIGFIVYLVSKKDKKGLAGNLSMAFDKPADDPFITKAVRNIFINYGQYIIDFFFMPQQQPDKLKKRFAYLKGEEHLQKALAKGNGAILTTPHLGNWEIGGHMMRALNYPLAIVALQHNTEAANALFNKLRGDKGIKVFEVKQSPFSGIEIVRYLRNNGIVALSGDKDFFGKGMPINFFGQKVNFPIGPVTLAMNSGATLIPTFVLKQPDGRYFGVMEEPIELTVEGDRDAAIKDNLNKIARVFETYIRRYPDQWYCPDPITEPAGNFIPDASLAKAAK